MPRWLFGFAALLGLTAPAMATDLPTTTPARVLTPVPVAMWTVTVGVEGRIVPSYEGAKSYTVVPVPLFSVRRAGTPAAFVAPRDGLGFAFVDTGQFQAGPALKVKLPRREGSNSDLQGLGNVDWAFEAGAFAQYWVAPWLRARAELRQGMGGHSGLVSDLTADVVVPFGPQWTLSGGPRVTLATSAAVDPYFSITQIQSTNSGLPVYNARGGLYSYGAGAQARYAWSPQWTTHVFVEYARLASGAGDSPLVIQHGSRDQFQTGVGVAYSFDVPAWW